MGVAERIDLLLHAFLARFFTIPGRQPASGAVTISQMRVLWILDLGKRSTVGGVAERLGVSKSTATELVNRLVDAGHVRREEGEIDRRQAVLTLRPKGRALMAEFALRRRERIQKLLRRIDRRDARRMVGALEELNRIVSQWPNEN